MKAMKKVLNLYKKVGETPLERIVRFRKDNPEYKDVKMTYLGRLDPVAEGVLLVAAGDEVKNREKYLSLPKTYLFDILWCFETDTYDVLGLVTKVGRLTEFSEVRLQIFLEKLKGEHNQKYPPFSSKPVRGKPLFEIARGEGVVEADIPSKIIKIYKVEHIAERVIRDADLERNILKSIFRVKGDFRQSAIIKKWGKVFDNATSKFFHISRIRIECSSGTYVRSIAHDFGKKMSTGAIAFRIIREKVGSYDIKDSTR